MESKTSKRVLITGADGFIGSNVLEFLLATTDWEFVAICSWRHHGNPLNLKPNERVEVITHDLTGPVPELGHFDYILNLASESHVDRSIADPVPFVENNVSSTLQMLEYARHHLPKVFVQFSTDEVYGANDHEEWDVLEPSSPYAGSKAAQEVLCISWYKTYQVPIVITNSNNIIGPNQNPEKMVPKSAGLIRADREVTIHTVDGVPGRRHWNPVGNVSSAIAFILSLTPSKYPDSSRPDRYGLGGGKELDNLEMAQLIASIIGKPLKYHYLEGEVVRPGYDKSYPKTEGTLESLGWTPPLTLEEGLQWLKQT